MVLKIFSYVEHHHHVLFADGNDHIIFFFFFNDPAPPEIPPLPLHDALPISRGNWGPRARGARLAAAPSTIPLPGRNLMAAWVKRARNGWSWSGRRFAMQQITEDTRPPRSEDRKSTRLNSSHSQISYAVFCLK